MAWCDDPKDKKYNEEIKTSKIRTLKKIYTEKIISMII